jgi:hypothetical protein
MDIKHGTYGTLQGPPPIRMAEYQSQCRDCLVKYSNTSTFKEAMVNSQFVTYLPIIFIYMNPFHAKIFSRKAIFGLCANSTLKFLAERL